MAEIRTSVTIDAPPDVVWADIRDISSHVEWMADAESIHFTSDARSGTGTTFDCETRIGPFRTTDRMEITDWVDGERMGVRHVGLVAGSGVFTLEPHDVSGTTFTWTEDLRFPWWMGGPVGAAAGRPVMRWIWQRNLRRLASRFT